MKKKILTLLLVTILCIVSVLSLAACNKGDNTPKDTFYKGTLSEENYATADAAAEAFLANEISGDAINAQLVGYSKQSDLSQAEIDALNITAEEKAQITSAEKGVVTYTESSDEQTVAVTASAAPAGAAVVKSKNITVYIIVIDSYYKYYAPSLNSGDVVTKSYFDEVFDPAKYTNCTIMIESTSKVTAKPGAQKQTQSVVSTITMKLAGNLGYATMSIPTMAENGAMTSTTMEFYYVFHGDITDEDFDLYLNSNGSWQKVPTATAGVDLDFSVTPTNDNSYFIKTETGFKLNSDKLAEYVKTTMNTIFNSYIGFNLNFNSVTANSESFVNDGRIYKEIATASINFGPYMGMSGTIEVNSVSTYSNFGTTTVTLPDGIIL